VLRRVVQRGRVCRRVTVQPVGGKALRGEILDQVARVKVRDSVLIQASGQRNCGTTGRKPPVLVGPTIPLSLRRIPRCCSCQRHDSRPGCHWASSSFDSAGENMNSKMGA